MATLAAAGPGYKSMMMKKMAKHYFDQMCWGKDNQMEKYKSIKESLAACMGEAAPAPRAMPQGAMPLNLVRAFFLNKFSLWRCFCCTFFIDFLCLYLVHLCSEAKKIKEFVRCDCRQRMFLCQVMKPVHSYQLPASTYSIVPPYQFARYTTIYSCLQIVSITLNAGITLWGNEQRLRKRLQSSSTTGSTSR